MHDPIKKDLPLELETPPFQPIILKHSGVRNCIGDNALWILPLDMLKFLEYTFCSLERTLASTSRRASKPLGILVVWLVTTAYVGSQ